MGTEHSKGTKIFSLVGKVVNTGLVEVPMGTTLRQIVFDIGGGIPRRKNSRRFRPEDHPAAVFRNGFWICRLTSTN
jgi:NADH:ubiquinone oxidoreductase subunit F (NADH-binding)